IDGGYFSKETFVLLDQIQKMRRVDFVLRIHSELPLIEATKKKRQEKEWEHIAPHIQVLRLPNQQVLVDWKKQYTVLLIREKRKRIISKKKRITHKTVEIEYPLVTTLSHWQTK